MSLGADPQEHFHAIDSGLRAAWGSIRAASQARRTGRMDWYRDHVLSLGMSLKLVGRAIQALQRPHGVGRAALNQRLLGDYQIYLAEYKRLKKRIEPEFEAKLAPLSGLSGSVTQHMNAFETAIGNVRFHLEQAAEEEYVPEFNWRMAQAKQGLRWLERSRRAARAHGAAVPFDARVHPLFVEYQRLMALRGPDYEAKLAPLSGLEGTAVTHSVTALTFLTEVEKRLSDAALTINNVQGLDPRYKRKIARQYHLASTDLHIARRYLAQVHRALQALRRVHGEGTGEWPGQWNRYRLAVAKLTRLRGLLPPVQPLEGLNGRSDEILRWPGQFPRKCNRCDRRLTEALWRRLPFIGLAQQGKHTMMEYRNCTCGSTLVAIVVPR